MKLYGMNESGNCWKAATILALTGHAFEWVHTDANAGGTQTTAFLAVNPIGKVPALVLEDGTVLAESNAILLHFAEARPGCPPLGRVGQDHRRPGLHRPDLLAGGQDGPRPSGPGGHQGCGGEARPAARHRRGAARAPRLPAGDDFTPADIQFGHVLFRYFDIPVARQIRPGLHRYYDMLTTRPAFREHVMVSYEELRVRD